MTNNLNSLNFLTANSVTGMERLQDDEPVTGYNYNRIVDAFMRQTNEWPFCWGYQPVDGTFQTRNRFWLTTDILFLSHVFLVFSLQPFHVANVTVTPSGSTTGAGSAHNHAQGTSDAESGHNHNHNHALVYLNAAPGVAITWNAGGSQLAANAALPNDFNTVQADATGSSGHTHALGNGGNESAHTHSLGTFIGVPPTSMYEAGMAQGCHLIIDGIDRTSALGGPWGTGTAIDVGPLDITSYVATSGWHELNVTSTTIGGVTASIYVKSVIQSL